MHALTRLSSSQYTKKHACLFFETSVVSLLRSCSHKARLVTNYNVTQCKNTIQNTI